MNKLWIEYPNNWPPVGTRCNFVDEESKTHLVEITAHGCQGVCIEYDEPAEFSGRTEYYVDMREKSSDIFQPLDDKGGVSETVWCDIAKAILEGDMNPHAPPKGDLRRLYAALRSGLLIYPE